MPTQAELEQQQLQEYFARQRRNQDDSRGKRMMDFGAGPEDVTPYLSMRHPGTTPLKGMADPYCMLKDGEKKREAWLKSGGPEGGQFVWSRSSGAGQKIDTSRVIRQLTHQGKARPVEISEIDTDSPYAIFDDMNVDTREGPKKIVTCGGQCLYELTLKTAIEIYGMPVMRYKANLAEMQFGSVPKTLAAEGYGEVPPSDWQKFTGSRDNNGSNMSVGPARTENALDS
jgi:hypothetical protein